MPPPGRQDYGPGGMDGAQPFFQYSQCNGRKKALCVRCLLRKIRAECQNLTLGIDRHQLLWPEIRAEGVHQRCTQRAEVFVTYVVTRSAKQWC